MRATRSPSIPPALRPLAALLVAAVLVVGPGLAVPPPAAAAETADDDATLDLEAHRGQVVLLDFWASWCAPCVKSFPWLSSLQVRHRDDGLVVIGVNVDRSRADADAFLKHHAPEFSTVYDPEGVLAEEYDLQGMPCSFLIGRNGKRRFEHVGFKESDREDIEDQIRKLLAEPPPEKENP